LSLERRPGKGCNVSQVAPLRVLKPKPRSAATGGASSRTVVNGSMVHHSGVPNARYIRERVPIADVARVLDLEVFDDGMIRCWHSERHQHGDRTPSVGIWKKLNRVKCFGNACVDKPLGPIDLVMDVRACDAGEAIRWIAQHFDVPRIPKGKHLVEPKDERARYGQERPLELLVKSGLFARLSVPACQLAVAFVELAPESQRDEQWAKQISYRGLAQYSGVRSDASIAKGLAELQGFGWLRRDRGKTRSGEGPIRDATTYIVTPFSDTVLELANATAADLRAAIEEERNLRRERRTRHSKA